MALVFGYLIFTAACAILAEAPKNPKSQSAEVAKLAFHPKPLDAHSSFTRQAADGELESADETARQGGRLLMVTGILLQSQTLSVQTVLREHQLPPIPIPSGSRSILFNRLII